MTAALFALVAGAGLVSISGHAQQATGKHTVYVYLWAADGFLEKPVQTQRFDAGVDPAFRFEVAPGKWALSAIEDTNENAVLDVGMFGPKEPSGFLVPFHKWRKPLFADVELNVQADFTDGGILLH